MKKILFTITAFGSILPLLAQGVPPKTPIDGGLTLLLAAGAAMGGYKIAKKE